MIDGFTYGGRIIILVPEHKQLKGHMEVHPLGCGNRLVSWSTKYFFWLLLQDKLSTRGVLRRRNMVLDDYTCVGCGVGVEETVDHLFLNCPFAVQCWALINLDSSINLQPLQLLEFFRSRLQVSFFMEIIILLCWSIWGWRNALIFESQAETVHDVKESFKSHFSLVIYRAKSKHVNIMKAWLDSLV